jgi:hypothetical protein
VVGTAVIRASETAVVPSEREGPLTQVYLNAAPPVPRFFVVATPALDDEVIDRATSLAFKYESEYPKARRFADTGDRSGGDRASQSSVAR